MLEFACGPSTEIQLKGNMRSWSALLSRLRTNASARDNRAAAIRPPVNWQGSGLFQLKWLDDELWIVHADTKVEKRLDVPFIDKFAVDEVKKGLYIEQNWSELLCELTLGDATVSPVPFGHLFVGVGQVKRPALTDEPGSGSRRLRRKTSSASVA
eukprot:3699-Amphidinium_carterae.1